METSHIYSGTVIWTLIDYANILAIYLYPILLILIAIFWFLKAKSKLSFVTIIGSFLVFSAKVLHLTIDEVSSVALGSLVLHIDQNVLVWFLYIYGHNIGLFIFSCALFGHFIRTKSV